YRVREEEYGVTADGHPKPVPYRVAQATPALVLVQPPLDGHLGAYQVVEWENALSEYDTTAVDPRIEHCLNVEFDAFGHPLRSARLAYARRALPGVERLPEQRDTQLHVSTSGFVNHSDGRYQNGSGAGDEGNGERDGEPFHLVGVQVEGRDYWVSGFAQLA